MRSSHWLNAGLGKGLMGVVAGVLCLCGTANLSLAQSNGGKPGDATAQRDPKKFEKRDLVIFRTGNKVEGMILEETDTTIKMIVVIAGIQSTTTYNKSDILEIKKDAFKPEPAKEDEKKSEEKKPDAPVAATDPMEIVDTKGNKIPEGNLKIYAVTFGGEFGRDLSQTPLKEIVDDMARVQPDVIIVRFDHAFAQYGQGTVDFDQKGQEQYDRLEKARELDTMLMDRINLSGDFKKKPRCVAWVKKALGGAAFLPFTFPEIYFTSDGFHGGIGGLDHMFDGVGDDVVREKQRSLRLARARGLCEKGGHDSRIMTAMSRSDYILSYRIVGGKAEFLEGKLPPDAEWYVLKDDGKDDRADSIQDVIRMKGNDYLTLDAKTAFDIGFSKGTADSMDELLQKMGIERNYSLVKNRAGDTFREWSKSVGKAESDIERLIRQFRGIQVQGTYQERTAARGRQKTLLRQIQAIAKVYREAINPRQVGDPDGLIDQIEIAISRIETAQRLDRP